LNRHNAVPLGQLNIRNTGPLVTAGHAGGIFPELSYDIIKKNGTVFPALLSAMVVKDTRGTMVAINAVLTDNMDRKHYERELLLAENTWLAYG
jgi:hypothetical protein